MRNLHAFELPLVGGGYDGTSDGTCGIDGGDCSDPSAGPSADFGGGGYIGTTVDGLAVYGDPSYVSISEAGVATISTTGYATAAPAPDYAAFCDGIANLGGIATSLVVGGVSAATVIGLTGGVGVGAGATAAAVLGPVAGFVAQDAINAACLAQIYQPWGT